MAMTPDGAIANVKRLAFFEDWFNPVAQHMLEKRPDIDLVRLEFAVPVDENWAEISRAHGYQIKPRGELREPWFGNAGLLQRCPSLLAICASGAGYDMVDVDACTAAGVIVCNQSGYNSEAVAEHALGYMITLSKKIALLDRVVRRELIGDRFKYTGNDLRGKTVGIVGIGHIGSRVAELCRHLFGMTVLACDPYLTAEQIAERNGEKVELDELLRRSDFVTVHCPRSSETMNMFGAAQFAAMKPTAYFINTARGGIHDEDSLAAALQLGRPAAAALDVFLQEPPPRDHKLLALDNVVAGIHTAGMTHESLYNTAVATAEQWVSIFAGEQPPRMVNPEAWPRYVERFTAMFGFAPE